MVWPWGRSSLWTIPLTSKKEINITLTLDLDIFAFFGLGDIGLFHSRLCRLVNGSYSKIHDSSPVIIQPSKFGSVSSCVRMSWHTSTCRSFCSSVNNLGTIFAQIFLILSSSIMIVHTLLLFILNSFAIILTVKRRSLHTCRTRSTFSSVLLVDGLPLLESSSTSSLPSLNRLCHSKIDILALLHFHRWSRQTVGVSPSRTRNFKLVCCSVLIVLSQQKNTQNILNYATMNW